MPVLRDLLAGGHAAYWLKGGRHSGKSSFAALAVVMGLARDPKASALCLRQNANTLAGSVYEKIRWALRELGWSACDRWEYRRAPLEIINRRTGQRVVFRGLDDPGNIRSTALPYGYFKYAWFEEAGQIQGGERAIRDVIISAARGGVTGFQTLLTYNPPRHPSEWINRAALRHDPDRLTHASTYLDLPAAWVSDTVRREAEALRVANDRAYKNEFLGEVTGTGGQVFENLTVRAIPDAELERCERVYWGLDFGFASDPDALIGAAYDARMGTVRLLHEYYGSHTPAETLAERVKALCGRHPVACDSAEPRMIDTLKKHGVLASPVKKGPGSLEHGMRWLQERAMIVADPARTPNAARELAAYEYRQDRQGNVLPEYPDRDNHAIDALRYALEAVAAERAGAVTLKKRDLGIR